MRKLSFEENLRHRLNDRLYDTQKTIRKKMRPVRKELEKEFRKGMRNLPRFARFGRRDEGMSTEKIVFLSLGVAAGVAAGVFLAQKYGGFAAVGDRLRNRFGGGGDLEGEDHERHRYNGQEYGDHDYDDGHDDFGELSPMEELEERVLEAYRNDPILAERAIDIGAIDEGIIELTGWVHAADEATHAVTIARGTPGVETVVNRLAVREEEDRFDDYADHYEQGYDSFTESQWNGQQRGIGRSRYSGRASDPDRNPDALSDLEGFGRSASPPSPGGETDGSPISPSGVPKGDHVKRPDEGGSTRHPPRGD